MLVKLPPASRITFASVQMGNVLDQQTQTISLEIFLPVDNFCLPFFFFLDFTNSYSLRSNSFYQTKAFFEQSNRII